jgi:hypothetical protein
MPNLQPSSNAPPAANLSANGNTLTITAPITGDAAAYFYNGNFNISAPIHLDNALTIFSSNTVLNAHLTCTSLNVTADLSGSGTITASQSAFIQSGHVSIGNTPGELGDLLIDSPTTTFGADTMLLFDLAPSVSDHLFTTGDLLLLPSDQPYNLGASLSLNFLAPPTGDIYTLITASSITGAFSSITGLPDGYAIEYTPTSILLVPTLSGSSIPEPTTLSVLTLSLLPLLRRSRPRLDSTKFPPFTHRLYPRGKS